MLRELLRLAADRGGVELGAMGRALGVGPRQVAQMLETLERQGYLARTGAGCDAPCAGCPASAGCVRESRARLWMLTEKGARLLERRA